MIYPLVRDLAAEGLPVAVTCRVLGFSKQGYYAWLAKPCSDRDYDEAYLINTAVDIHADDPMFGYRFIADELLAAGHEVGERESGGSALSSGSGRGSRRRRAMGRRPVRRSMTTWSSATSLRPGRISCG